jgi:murein L,D-transpeptidase YcbB/YkuD
VITNARASIAKIPKRPALVAWAIAGVLSIGPQPSQANVGTPDVAPIFPEQLTESQLARFAALSSASEHGLSPADYGVAHLAALLSAGTQTVDADFAASLDVSWRNFTADLAHGRVAPEVDPDWHIPARAAAIEPAAGLDSDRFAPEHAQYQRLRDAMRRHLDIASDGGWPALPDGPLLYVGVRDARVEIARGRLRQTGDFVGDTEADAWLFGARLFEAVRRFQSRHNLVADGVIGDETRAAMNVPVAARIEQLAVAMERWRWLPRDLGDEYVWINAAELVLHVVSHGDRVLSSRAIVGHSTRPTPSLQSEIRQLVFNPTWSVPLTIASEDLLPKLKRDPEFIRHNDFRVYNVRGAEVDADSIDWSTVNPERFPYRFVQQPGPGNSLGLMKVVFNNPYDIYLHDTPTKGLFSLRTRTFSSGCVRVEKAGAFADYLLANHREPADSTIAQWLETPNTRFVDLQRVLPIYLVYITSWVDEDGQVNFRPDLYRRDAPVAAALRDNARPANVAPVSRAPSSTTNPAGSRRYGTAPRAPDDRSAHPLPASVDRSLR